MKRRGTAFAVPMLLVCAAWTHAAVRSRIKTVPPVSKDQHLIIYPAEVKVIKFHRDLKRRRPQANMNQRNICRTLRMQDRRAEGVHNNNDPLGKKVFAAVERIGKHESKGLLVYRHQDPRSKKPFVLVRAFFPCNNGDYKVNVSRTRDDSLGPLLERIEQSHDPSDIAEFWKRAKRIFDGMKKS